METYSVLLVDDDKKLLAVLQECFLQENFTVYTAMDGGAALAAFEQHAPSIISSILCCQGLMGARSAAGFGRKVQFLSLCLRPEMTSWTGCWDSKLEPMTM